MRLAHAVLIVMSFFGFGIPLSLLDPGFVANTTPPPTTLLDFYPAAMSLSSPSIEACTTANNCVLDCTATTSGGPWACVNGSGATVNVTVPQGVSVTVDGVAAKLDASCVGKTASVVGTQSGDKITASSVSVSAKQHHKKKAA